MGQGAASENPGDAFAPPEVADEPGEAPIDLVRGAARQAARRAFDARVRDADVADLVYDSLIDTDQPRVAFEDVRRLRFVAGETHVDLDVDDLHETVHVALQIVPSRSADAEVRAGDDSFVVFIDEDGRAEFDLPRGSLASLVIPPAAPGRRGLQTAWVRL